MTTKQWHRRPAPTETWEDGELICVVEETGVEPPGFKYHVTWRIIGGVEDYSAGTVRHHDHATALRIARACAMAAAKELSR
jgi:hypothetical protein